MGQKWPVSNKKACSWLKWAIQRFSYRQSYSFHVAEYHKHLCCKTNKIIMTSNSKTARVMDKQLQLSTTSPNADSINKNVSYKDKNIFCHLSLQYSKSPFNLDLNFGGISIEMGKQMFYLCPVPFFLIKKVQERIWSSGMHYHICIACPCKVHIKYTNKKSLGRKGVGTAFPNIPTEKNTASSNCRPCLYNTNLKLYYRFQQYWKELPILISTDHAVLNSTGNYKNYHNNLLTLTLPST